MTVPHEFDHLTQAVLTQAVEHLGALSTLVCVDDPGVRLHLLAHLDRHLHTALAGAARDCYHHGYQPDEITDILHRPLPT